MSVPLPGRILPALPGTFRALRHRDFRLLWLGQVVSLTGTWMQSVAQGWLVLRLSDSAFVLGLVGFFNYAPLLLFGLIAGAAADRLPRRRVLLATQTSAMILAFALAALTGLGWVRVWHVAALAFALGTVSAFDIPIRQSYLQDLVGRRDLQNAIALNSMAFNGARFVGPAAAGVVVASFGESPCFLLNGLSFLAVLSGLAMIRTDGAASAGGPRRSWAADIREGLGFARRSARARAILLMVAVTAVFGASYSILMPVFARDVLGVGSRELGFLMGSSGLGALIGALALARRRSTRHSGRIVAIAAALFGSSLVGFSLSRNLAVSMALLVLVGAGLLVQLGTSNAFLQLLAPAGLRGRVVSLYLLGFIGMSPAGALLAGTLARWIGAPRTVGLGGAVCVATALVFAAMIPRLRRGAGPAS